MNEGEKIEVDSCTVGKIAKVTNAGGFDHIENESWAPANVKQNHNEQKHFDHLTVKLKQKLVFRVLEIFFL